MFHSPAGEAEMRDLAMPARGPGPISEFAKAGVEQAARRAMMEMVKRDMG
ncbi:hypothetical protein ACFSHP_15200 [Novosphingobium panipatense]